MKKIITSLIILFIAGWTGITEVSGQARLYGVTNFGGDYNKGVIYEWNPATATYSNILNYGDTTARPGVFSLSLYEGKFYGVGVTGGWWSQVYEWDPISGTYTVKCGVDATNPRGGFTLHDGKFYFVCFSGGAYGGGAIVEWDPETNVCTNKYEFVSGSIDGFQPIGGLTSYNGKLYGMTFQGGTVDAGQAGVIFNYDPVTDIYTKEYDFLYDDYFEGYSHGGLVLHGNKFYGIGTEGLYGYGLLFEYDPSANIVTQRYNFQYSGGSNPEINPVVHEGKLYGVTTYGGSFDYGVIYEYDPASGIYTKKHDFDYMNGAYSQCILTMSGGIFYGDTQEGGINEMGVFFTWDPITNIFTKKFDFDEVNGSNPRQTSLLEYTPSGADNDGDGFSEANGDCNDANPDIYPGATELCNGIDDNCNGTIDEGLVHSISAWGVSYTPDYQGHCEGTTVMLTAVDGTLGTGAEWVWYEGGCGNGEPIGTGDTIYITPPVGAYYYFVRAEGTCNVTACKSAWLYFYPPPTAEIDGPGEVNVNEPTYFYTAAGAEDYIWNVSEGGTVVSGGGPYDDWIEVTWPTPGLEWVSVNYSNSQCHALEPAVVEVTVLDPVPHPDLAVSAVQSLSGNIIPGADLTVGWIVENVGDSVASGGWSQKISLVSGSSRVVLGYTQHADSLEVSGVSAHSATFNISQTLGLEGDVYIEVQLTPYPGLVEKSGGAGNNTALSEESVLAEKRLFLSIPESSIEEDDAEPVICTVLRSGVVSGSLNISLGNSDENLLSVPASVTIPSGQSGAVFSISSIDNGETGGNQELSITANGSGYPEASGTITVIDDEEATLDVSISQETAAEGEVVSVTVTRDPVTSSPLDVSLYLSVPQQAQVPASVTIDANMAGTSFNLTVSDDLLPEITGEVTVTAWAQGFLSGSDTLTITDNDIPQVAFTLSPDVVSEAAGAFASWGKVSRTGPGTGEIILNISAQPEGSVFFPAQVIIPANATEKQFNIGTVDNALLDGERIVEITATIYLNSCGCGVPAELGGEVSAMLTITDNDGPALTVSASPYVVQEGLTGAGLLTISRNTGPGAELTVTIQNSDPGEADIPTSAVIPDGESSVEVPFNTPDDFFADGDQIVSVSVSAAGYAGGNTWLMVTDRNLPDLSLADVVPASDSILVNQPLDVEFRVINGGFATLSDEFNINFYLSKNTILDAGDLLLGSISVNDDMEAGDTLEMADSFALSGITGNYFLIGKVNEQNSVDELIYLNNESIPAALHISPDYFATVSVDGEIFNGNGPIVITGSAETLEQLPAPNKAVDVYIMTNGTRRVIQATSDENGELSLNFLPVKGEAGDFDIGACYPGAESEEVQDSFTLLGIKYTGEPLVWNTVIGSNYSNTIQVQNTSGLDLHNVTVQVISAPAGCSLSFNQIGTLAGNQTALIAYSLSGSEVSANGNYQKVIMKLSSSEGVEHGLSAWYLCTSPTGLITADPVTLVSTMAKGQTSIREFVVQNIGMGETGLVTVEIPDLPWMTLISPDTLENISSFETAVVSLRLSPTDDLPLNVPVTGTFVITGENANSLTVPFSIETVSDLTGDLLVDVVDEYSYFSESGPHVEGAQVVLRHPYTGVVVAEGLTGPDGLFEAQDIPEGFYTITVQALKHSGYQNNIFIESGKVNETTVFISFQAVSYSWNVVPTQIGDSYEINVDVEFETNVPLPVLDINLPEEMPYLEQGEYYPFLLTLTNLGLITANNVTIVFPEDDPVYGFTFQVDPFDLSPQQMVQIPVVMERKATRGSGDDPDCWPVTAVGFNYICGPQTNFNWQKKHYKYAYMQCKTGEISGPGKEIEPPPPCIDCGGPPPKIEDKIDEKPKVIQPPPPVVIVIDSCQTGDTVMYMNGGRGITNTSVCASISLRFSQALMMTREAFDGTLTIYNGNETTPMQNISLQLEVKDQNGIIRNDLFQINTIALDVLTEIDGSGNLGALQTGSAVVRFIPEKGAAPLLPTTYSFGGKLSYLDPFTSETVTRPLFPVALQVNPSPDLYLTYFMQRDIFGDDALTPDVEPSIPAEFAVMIHNKGAGTAQNVLIESAQPEIIENEKGLQIDFEIIGSNLGGKPVQLGLYDVLFGDIEGGKIGIGQWWFTSSLLGHFKSYEASVNHLDSYGNQDLSLIGGVEVHELIHSISVYGAGYDTINDFLVNDIPDAKDYPDMLYFSTGSKTIVHVADTSVTDGSVTVTDTIVIMTVTPSAEGWNYTRLDDPADGLYQILSVTREDGQEIPLDNIWRTYATIPDGGEPVYEKKMHFADLFDALEPVDYTIVFGTPDQDALEVESIDGIAQFMNYQPIETVTVKFSEPVLAETFTFADMTLKLQGGADLMDAGVVITPVNDSTFTVDISEKTLASGFYNLVVSADEVSDLGGNTGNSGKQVSWVQSLELPWYRDLDNDSYGDALVMVMSDFQPAGYVSNPDDCDDSNPDVNPGAEEVCGNDADDNCNGQVDEGCEVPCDISVSAGEDVTTWFGLPSMQQVVRTAIVTGGTPPFTYSWTMDRPLICNQQDAYGDESFTGGTCNDNTCPTDGSPLVNPSCSGSETIVATLLDTAMVCVTVTDANGCVASDCFTVMASDIRCFRGNQPSRWVRVCHPTGNPNHPYISLCVDTNAVAAHLAHDDYIGYCNGAKSEEIFEDEDHDAFFDFSLFPNPAGDRITVSFHSHSESAYTIGITDMTGRVVARFKANSFHGDISHEIDLVNVERGIYTVTLTLDGQRMVKKLVRE